MLVVLLYCPPKSMYNFFSEQHELLTLTCAMSPCLVISTLVSDCTECCELMSVFEYFNRVQHVNFTTHSKGHTLDFALLVYVMFPCLALRLDLSDHLFIKLNCEMPLPRLRMKSTILYHNLNSIYPLLTSESVQTHPSDITEH